MRTLIILARKHGGKSLELVSGPEIPAHQQAAKFKKDFQTSGGVNDAFEHAELWSSDAGRKKQIRLISPAKAKEIAEAHAKAVAEAEKAAAQKAKAEAEAKAKAETPKK